MQSFSSGGLHFPRVAKSLVKPSLTPPVHVKKNWQGRQVPMVTVTMPSLCYRDHSDPASSFMARLLAALA